jgi:hypothetical protein
MRYIKRVLGITVLMVMALMAFGATAALAAPLAQGEDPVEVDPETVNPEVETDGRVSPCGISREVMQQIIDRDALEAATAEALGMSVEELQAAKDSGQRISDIAAEQGVELEAIQAAVQDTKAEMVQQALDDELITAEQAECILSSEGGLCGGGRGRGHHGSPRSDEIAPAETEGASLNA